MFCSTDIQKQGACQKKGGPLSLFLILFWCLKYGTRPRYAGKQTKKHNRRASGQAMMETLISLPLISACFILCLLFFHAFAQTLYMDHQLYQSLICLAEGKPKTDCEKTLQQKVKSFFWTGKLKNIKFKKGEEKWSGQFTWETGFWTIPFQQTLKKGALL